MLIKIMSVAHAKLSQIREGFYSLLLHEKSVVSVLLLMILGFLMLVPVWGIGIMHTDDALWYLALSEGKDASADWAQSQGRIYALIVGKMMLYVLSLTGSTYAEVLKYGSFSAVIVLYGAVIASYFNRNLALLSLTLFIGLNAVRADGSVVFSYPLLIWPSLIAFALSMLAARIYTRNGSVAWLVANALLLGFSMFTNEGITFTLIILAALAAVRNLVEIAGTRPQAWWYSSARSRGLIVAYVVPTGLYALGYVAYLKLFPSMYDGSALTILRPMDSIRTLASFSFSGSFLYNIYQPYTIVFGEPGFHNGYNASYTVRIAMRDILSNPTAFIFGFISALVFGKIVFAIMSEDCLERKFNIREFLAIIVGLLLAILPVILVAISLKYIKWHTVQGIDSYATSVVSSFGVSMALAGAMSLTFGWLPNMRMIKLPIFLVTIIVFGVCSALNHSINERISSDLRAEGMRWDVFERGMQLMDAVGMEAELLSLPQFSRGSWYTATPSGYWSKLAKARFEREVSIVDGPLLRADVARTAVVSYETLGTRHTAVLVERMSLGPAGDPVIDEIAIDLGRNFDERLPPPVCPGSAPLRQIWFN